VGPNAGTPVVALTANTLDLHHALWAELGVDTLIAKPIDPAALMRTLRQARSAPDRLGLREPSRASPPDARLASGGSAQKVVHQPLIGVVDPALSQAALATR
jgi:DNA-binding response OmpR family regulator